MSLRSLFEWLDALPSSLALRESLNAYPILLTSHVVSMSLFAGLIGFWDLRLIGMTLKKVPVSNIPRRLFPLAIAGFVICSITGLLLFYSQPMRFYGNFYFWFKNLLMFLLGVNALAFHLTIYHSVAAWDTDAVTPFAARLAGVSSLVMWAAVVVTGRMIAYSGLMPEWWDNLSLN